MNGEQFKRVQLEIVEYLIGHGNTKTGRLRGIQVIRRKVLSRATFGMKSLVNIATVVDSAQVTGQDGAIIDHREDNVVISDANRKMYQKVFVLDFIPKLVDKLQFIFRELRLIQSLLLV